VKGFGDGAGQAAHLQILDRAFARGVFTQQTLVGQLGLVHQLVETAMAGRGWGGRIGLVLHGQIELAGQFLHCLHEAQTIVVHEEPQRRTMRAAAKAVIKLLFRADREGRGFFVVERAEALKIASGFFELDAAPHDFDDIGAGQQVVDERLCNLASHATPPL